MTEDALKSEVGLDEVDINASSNITAAEAVPDINSLLAEYEKYVLLPYLLLSCLIFSLALILLKRIFHCR